MKEDPQNIEAILQDCKDRLEVQIRIVVPPTEISFINEMKYIFEPYCNILRKWIENENKPNISNDSNLIEIEIKKRTLEVQARTPNFNQKHWDYLHAFHKALGVDFNESPEISDELKYINALKQKEVLANRMFIENIPKSEKTPLTPWVDYVDSQVERFKKGDKQPITFDELFNTSFKPSKEESIEQWKNLIKDELHDRLNQIEEKIEAKISNWKLRIDLIECAAFCQLLFDKKYFVPGSTKRKSVNSFALSKYGTDISIQLESAKNKDRETRKVMLLSLFT